MKNLTKKQTEILDYIHEFLVTHRYAPTYREICEHFRFSSLGTVHNHIQSLKKKGVLQNTPRGSRSLTPMAPPKIKEGPLHIEIPLVGYITTNSPMKTFSHIRMVPIPASFLRNPETTYAVTVHGTAFIEELIQEGDLLIVEVRQQVNQGETVVALLEDTETVVRRYYRDGSRVKLVGAQPLHPPLVIDITNVAIQAVVIGLLRTY